MSIEPTPAPVEVTRVDHDRALEVFNDILCDMGNYVEFGAPHYKHEALETIASHCARHRIAHSAPAGEVDPVFIWSGEHNAYWRTGGNGYTVRASKAGIWTREEAVRQTIHCGPEKRIELEPVAVPTHPAPPADLVERIEQLDLLQETNLPNGEWDMETFRATLALCKRHLSALAKHGGA